MDTLTQLGELIGALFIPALILVVVVWPLVITWLFIRAFRDLHSISESLHWIAHCTGSPEQKAMERIARAPKPTGAISTSAFGR